MKEKVFNIKLTGKSLILAGAGVGIAVVSFVFGHRCGKRSSKEELHNLVESKPAAQEQQAPAAAAPQPQA